jgi:hypothetical protein
MDGEDAVVILRILIWPILITGVMGLCWSMPYEAYHDFTIPNSQPVLSQSEALTYAKCSATPKLTKNVVVKTNDTAAHLMPFDKAFDAAKAGKVWILRYC